MLSMFSPIAQANVQSEADDDFTHSIHPQAGLLRLSLSLSLIYQSTSSPVGAGLHWM